jgi:cytochrome c oxidase subunit 3
MNAGAVLDLPALHRPGGDRALAASIGLWVFMGVASSLFALFLMAYVLRMNGSDAVTIALPWQPWLSSAFLITGSLCLQRASVVARGPHPQAARGPLWAGGFCALAFLGAQLWTWQILLDAQLLPASHPAASFFYLLTAMHGLHMAGGLAGWAWTAAAARRLAAEPAAVAWRVALCARYWHFMLAVWLLLFAALRWVTPELARFICGTA